MKWFSWYNSRSGNRTTKAHAADSHAYGTRTYCGAAVGTLVAPAGRLPRCQLCQFAIKRQK
jgi:hypothetical protein